MKFPSSVLLLPLLGGAIFCWNCVWTRYRFARRKGYEIFFMAAIAGFLLLAVVYTPLRLIEMGDPRFKSVFLWWDRFAPLSPYLGSCVLALIISWPAAWLFNQHIDAERVRRKEIRENGDELEQMIMDAVVNAYERPQLYMMTLSSGKVYIGVILSENDPYGRRAYVTLLKFASGYRDERQQIDVTTTYAEVIQKIGRPQQQEKQEQTIPDHITAEDFQVVVPKAEIMQLSRYEPDLYHFFPDGPTLDG